MNEAPEGVVTSTVAFPAVPGGVIARMEVELMTSKLAASVPAKVTFVAPVKLLPGIVTAVPPEAGPDAGLRVPTTGRSV